MTGNITRLDIGRFTALVYDYSARPREWATGRPLVVYGHGAGNDPREAAGTTWGLSAPAALIRALVAQGWAVVCPTTQNQWGNATAQARDADAVAWAVANLGCSDEVVRVGASAGVCKSLTMAAEQPAKTLCVVGMIPAVHLQQIRVDNPSGLRTFIDAAYGVTYPAALPANADPYDRAAPLAAIPTQLWYASDDPVSVDVATFGAAIGADLHDVGALGHTDAAIAAATPATVVDFIRAHL